MKYLPIILLLCGFTFQSKAQHIPDYPDDSYIDSAVNSVYMQDSLADYNHIYDSVSTVILSQIVRNMVRHRYIWPCRARNEHLTDTYFHLLEHKYHFDPVCISSGCVDQQCFARFDTLMSIAIADHFGADFFTRTEKEANSLDKRGAGLTLPYLEDSSTAMPLLMKKLSFLDSIRKNPDKTYGRLYIILEFKKGQIRSANLAINMFGIQTRPEFFELEPDITQAVKSVKWVSPQFRHKPADKHAVLDLEDKTTFFSTILIAQIMLKAFRFLL
jgi:hypothetical protein